MNLILGGVPTRLWEIVFNFEKCQAIYGYVIMPNPHLTGRAGYSCTLGNFINHYANAAL